MKLTPKGSSSQAKPLFRLFFHVVVLTCEKSKLKTKRSTASSEPLAIKTPDAGIHAGYFLLYLGSSLRRSPYMLRTGVDCIGCLSITLLLSVVSVAEDILVSVGVTCAFNGCSSHKKAIPKNICFM